MIYKKQKARKIWYIKMICYLEAQTTKSTEEDSEIITEQIIVENTQRH